MAKLSKAAVRLLTDAGCNEVADDYIVLGTTDVTILLSRRAIEDLNRQARERDDAPAAGATGESAGEQPALEADMAALAAEAREIHRDRAGQEWGQQAGEQQP